MERRRLPKGFVVRDKAAASGLASTTRTFDGFAADFDGNGWKDVFYSRHGSVLPRLAMGSARGFSNAETGAFSTVDRHGCDYGDLDHDGAKDVFCAVGRARGKAIGRHELSLAVATKNRRPSCILRLALSASIRSRCAVAYRRPPSGVSPTASS